MGAPAPRAGTRTSRAVGGAAASLVQFGLQIGLQAALLPLALRLAGQEALGVYAIVIQALGYLTLTDLGFGAAAGRYLAQAHAADDGGARFGRVMATVRLFTLGTNALFFVLCVAMGWALPALAKASPELVSQGRWALGFVAVWGLVRTPLVVEATALTAVQHLARANLAAALGHAVRFAASLGLVFAGAGLFGMIAGHLLGEVATTVLQAAMFRRAYPGRRPGWGIEDTALARELLLFAVRAFGVSVGVRLIFHTDALVVGALAGAAAASVYYSTQIPAAVLMNVPLRISDSAAPAVNELWAQGAFETLRRSYLRLLRYALLASAAVGIGVAALNGPLVAAWLGPAQDAGPSMSAALGVFTVLVNAGHVGLVFVMASGRVGTLGGLVLAEGLVNLALSIALGRTFGLPGVMWATAAANLISTGYLFWKAQRLLELPWGDTFAALARVAFPAGVGLAFVAVVRASFVIEGWTRLAVAAAGLAAAFGLAAWRVGFTAEERGWVVAWLARSRRGTGAEA